MLLKPFWPEARFWNFCGILRPIFVSSSSFFKLYFLGVCVFFLPFFFSSGGSLDGDLTTSHTWVIILLERARAVPKIQRSNSLCFSEGCRSLLSLTTTSTFCFCFLIIIFKLECQIFEIGSCWIFFPFCFERHWRGTPAYIFRGNSHCSLPSCQQAVILCLLGVLDKSPCSSSHAAFSSNFRRWYRIYSPGAVTAWMQICCSQGSKLLKSIIMQTTAGIVSKMVRNSTAMLWTTSTTFCLRLRRGYDQGKHNIVWWCVVTMYCRFRLVVFV